MSSHAGETAWAQLATEHLAALAQRQRGSRRHRQPVGLIGPSDAGERDCDAAYRIAHALGAAGVAILCGGRTGVMEAAARGASEAGGVAIGLLPEEDDRHANAWLDIVLPTGMGEMRNALIARSSICLVAVGGGLGTLSEMALGLRWGKRLFTLHEQWRLADARRCDSVEEVCAQVAGWLVRGDS